MLMNIDTKLIMDCYSQYKTYFKELRRQLHQNPEVGWEEKETTKIIAKVFDEYEIPYRLLDPTGLIADIVPDSLDVNDNVLAIRSDIDALPIVETTGLDYASQNYGVSHSCGHDFHMASVIGAAVIIKQNIDKLTQPVRFIFQMAEETRSSGALEVIRQNGLDNVKEIYAIHTEPKLDVGKIGVRTGAITSAADIVSVEIKSTGGHSARPHLAGDVVAALGAIIQNTATVFSRLFDPRSVVSITWGSVQAGKFPNVIPNYGILKGTIRTTEVSVWESVSHIAKNALYSIAKPYNVEVSIDYEKGVPPVINDEEAVRKIENCIEYVHGQNTLYHSEKSLGGEDFAWYLQSHTRSGKKVSGAMVRMGAKTPIDEGGSEVEQDIHQSDLVVDERLLDYSVPFLAGLAFIK